METINAILMIFGYVRQNFVPVTFLLNIFLFVTQSVFEQIGIRFM